MELNNLTLHLKNIASNFYVQFDLQTVESDDGFEARRGSNHHTLRTRLALFQRNSMCVGGWGIFFNKLLPQLRDSEKICFLLCLIHLFVQEEVF